MKRIGLFIGIDKYANGIQPLECACRDALGLMTLFVKKGFDGYECLWDDKASGDRIVSKVLEMTGKLHSGDLFVLYFAGHGVEFDGKHYLIGANGFGNPRLKQGRVEVQELFDASAEPAGLRRMFIFDCCRKDLAAGRSVSYACPDGWNSRDLSLVRGDARQVANIPPFIINSCSTGEQAYELKDKAHGVFYHALHSVLGDAADPVRSFDRLIRRVDEAMQRTIGDLNCPQHVDASFTPGIWDKVPLFAEWETPFARPAAPAPAPVPVTAPHPAPAVPPAEPEPSAEELCRKGDECYDRKNYSDAVTYFRKAAEQGHEGARYELNRVSASSGSTGSPSTEGAAPAQSGSDIDSDWLEMIIIDPAAIGCLLGVPLAILFFLLGFKYSSACSFGFFIISLVVTLVCDRAARKHYEAGCRFFEARRYDEAVTCFRKAARRGKKEAKYSLGCCYELGHGVAPDPVRAVKWYRRAAYYNYAEAQKKLAECYEFGYGAAPDPAEAVKWYRKAAKKGNAEAKAALERLK